MTNNIQMKYRKESQKLWYQFYLTPRLPITQNDNGGNEVKY